MKEVLIDRLHQVEERIARACAQAGRPRQDVLLLAVTKVFPADAIHEAYALGLREFGENYVQEFETKADSVRSLPGARFHLIGHLQSNKSKKAAELFDTVHTVDSLKLARRLAESAGPQGIEILIEVKLSEEDSKHGCAPAELEELVNGVRAVPNVRLSGLMTIPPWSEDPELARPYFIQLRQLAARYNLPRLSMGMSNDLEVAIAEGSSIVRVGTALFGARKKA